jgi:predicted transcriptional regulator
MRVGPYTKKGIILLVILGMILVVPTLNNSNDFPVKKDYFFVLLHPFENNDNGGYIVTMGNAPISEGDIVDDSGTDAIITFWELPLWIQLSVISGGALSTFALLKYLPILLGKILSKDINPKMQEIASYIAENPGCMESEIAQDLDLKRGTLRYYLSRLSSDNRIQNFKKGKLKGLFHVTYSKTEEQKVLHLHKKNKNRKRMLEIITERPGITGKELANLLKIDKSTVHWHIKELHKDDLIDFKRNGRNKMYYPHVSVLSDDID